MPNPKVTFLLPAYNAQATIADTIESVLSQSLTDLELLIIDDASTDSTSNIIARIKDPRIRIVRNPQNLELAATLNRGLTLAGADYIARIDSDDICLPHRAQTQFDFLETHSDIAVVGSFVETFTADLFETGTTIAYPTDPALVAAGLLFRNTMAHPSVMLRNSALAAAKIKYDESIRRAQDYALWAACAAANLQLANIPEVLTRYRVHPGQATARESLASLTTAAAVRRSIIERLGIAPAEEELATHTHLALDDFPPSANFIHAAEEWLAKLHAANQKSKIFPADPFTRTLTGRFVALVRHANSAAIPLHTPPENSPFAKYIHPNALS
jgi:glycosyltransferase involved in cell wall biosynthesis